MVHLPKDMSIDDALSVAIICIIAEAVSDWDDDNLHMRTLYTMAKTKTFDITAVTELSRHIHIDTPRSTVERLDYRFEKLIRTFIKHQHLAQLAKDV